MTITTNTYTANTDNTVSLDAPIKRGEQIIDSITLRRPTAGELRGTTLNALANLEVDALSRILPRIATPMLTVEDVMLMDPSDLVQLGVVFAGFLTPKRLA